VGKHSLVTITLFGAGYSSCEIQFTVACLHDSFDFNNWDPKSSYFSALLPLKRATLLQVVQTDFEFIIETLEYT
jgi:hypothetical protein